MLCCAQTSRCRSHAINVNKLSLLAQAEQNVDVTWKRKHSLQCQNNAGGGGGNLNSRAER